jgi:hypothetical protein
MGDYTENGALGLTFNSFSYDVPTKQLRLSYTTTSTGATVSLAFKNNVGIFTASSGSGGSSHDPVTLGTATPGLSLAGQVLSYTPPTATTSTTGIVTSGDWNRFNNKEPALGNPSIAGYVLSSTAGGVRSWIPPTTLEGRTGGNFYTGFGTGAVAAANSTGNDIVGIGANALNLDVSGSFNTAVGDYSQSKVVSASYNSSLGYSTLKLNTTGASNTAIGALSLSANTTGSGNTSLGYSTLLLNSTGAWNTALGYSALSNCTLGVNNVGVGSISLINISTGSRNVGLGSNSLASLTTGNDNVGIGMYSLSTNTGGSNNTSIGKDAGFSSVTGSGNIFLGFQSGYYETGSNKLYISNSSVSSPLVYGDFSTNVLKLANTATISSAGIDLPSGSAFTIAGVPVTGSGSSGGEPALGNPSTSGYLLSSTTGGVRTWVPPLGLLARAEATGLYNTVLGYGSIPATTTGTSNTAIGAFTLNYLNTGNNNTAVGTSSLWYNRDGNDNTAVGAVSLNHLNGGSSNTAMGYQALNAVVTGNNNTGIGWKALKASTTSGNTALGYGALSVNTVGTSNTAMGSSALVLNVGGSNNTVMGESTLVVNTSGSSNTAIGQGALPLNQNGSFNTVIGNGAGASTWYGSSNVFLGYNAGYSEMGSNKLYVSNSSTTTPLIWGDFSANTLKVANTLSVSSTGVDLPTGANYRINGVAIGAQTLPLADQTFTGAIDLSNPYYTSYVDYTVTTALAVTVNATKVNGSTAVIVLKGDGVSTHIPTFTGLYKSGSTTFDYSSGTRNVITFVCIGTQVYFSISSVTLQ